jgi:predicted transcriptional regulator
MAVEESTSLGEAVRTMSENRVHHLLVHSSQKVVVGILSPLDVLDLIVRTARAGTA